MKYFKMFLVYIYYKTESFNFLLTFLTILHIILLFIYLYIRVTNLVKFSKLIYLYIYIYIIINSKNI